MPIIDKKRVLIGGKWEFPKKKTPSQHNSRGDIA